MTSERRRRITRMEAELICCSAIRVHPGYFFLVRFRVIGPHPSAGLTHSLFLPFGACGNPPTDHTDHTDFICSSRSGPCGVLPQALITRMTSERRRRITRMEAKLGCCSATRCHPGLFLFFFFMAIPSAIDCGFMPNGIGMYTWPEAMHSQ